MEHGEKTTKAKQAIAVMWLKQFRFSPKIIQKVSTTAAGAEGEKAEAGGESRAI